MPFPRTASPEALAALRDASTEPFWLDRADRPEPAPRLIGDTTADLAVVGGGYTGLWTALLAKEAAPSRDVVVVEATRVADGASGRNGGFCDSSLTHGLDNGFARFPAELARLQSLGEANVEAMQETLVRYGIDCSFERTGELAVATERHQLEGLREHVDLAGAFGEDATLLDAAQTRAIVDSPLFLGGVRRTSGIAILDPARLAWGLRRACLDLGVRLYERTPATGLARAGSGMTVRTSYGSIHARRVALATNAFPPLVRRLRHYIVPVYDYALVTEPLSPEQRRAVRWDGREGLGDAGNLFHYVRLTDDDRILFGGYDAIYYWRDGFGPQHEQRPETFGALATHFTAMFPQLDGLRFTHAWGGAIDTCSRFCPFWDTAYDGRVAWCAGYTGLGVGATRFGAAVILDLLDGRDTERTRLELVRTKPLPFPPEPVRSIGINLTRLSLERSDRGDGSRNAWLRLLDRLGLGFDS